MTQSKKARALVVNHIALEVGDIDAALDFYARIADFKLRGKSKDMAFIDLGDQFIALQKGSSQEPGGRHLDFYDPWGNRVQIVGYDDIQFSKALNVLRGMGMAHLTKSTKAIKNLRRKACRQTRLKLGLTPNLRIVNRSICRMQCGIYVSKSPVP